MGQSKCVVRIAQLESHGWVLAGDIQRSIMFPVRLFKHPDSAPPAGLEREVLAVDLDIILEASNRVVAGRQRGADAGHRAFMLFDELDVALDAHALDQIAIPIDRETGLGWGRGLLRQPLVKETRCHQHQPEDDQICVKPDIPRQSAATALFSLWFSRLWPIASGNDVSPLPPGQSNKDTQQG